LCVRAHNLQLDGLAVKLNGADLKVHSDGANVALCVGVILSRETGETDTVSYNSNKRKRSKEEKHKREMLYYI
jgi:hypothetical protein